MSKAKSLTEEPIRAIAINMSEEDRLRKDIYRSDMEKLQLFTKMLRRNALLKNVVITHK